MPAHPRPGRLVRHLSRPVLGVLLASVALPAWAYLSTMVRAATLSSEPAAVACTLCVLDQQGTGVQMSGNGQLLVHWGSMVVDSSSSSAVQLSGNAQVQSSESEVVGGLQESGNASTVPAFAEVPAPGDLDPFAALSEPTPGSTPTTFQATGHQSETASPGTYSSFQVSGQASVTLSPGVYVITQGFQVSGQATVSGSGVMLFFAGQSGLQLSGGSTVHLTSPSSGAYAGISLLYDRQDASAIQSTGNGSPSQRFVGGAIYAAAGVLGGSGAQELQVDGPVVVGSVQLNGGGTVLIDNVEASQTVAGATLTPTLGLALTSSEQSATPGDTVTYSATVSNNGAGLAVTGTVTATNNDATTARVAAYSETLQTASTGTCSTASNHGQTTSGWSDLAGTGGAVSGYSPLEPAPATGMTLSLTPQPATGVTYPSSGDPILGTTIQAGETATWDYTATVPLTPAQVTTLLTPSQVAQTRDSFHVEVLADGQTQGAGQLDTVNTGFCQLFQPGVSGDVTNVNVTVTPPSGPAVTQGPNQVAALGSLAPGASATGKVPFTVPVVAAKGATETDSAYVSRLQAANGSTLTASASASGSSYTGAVRAPSASATVTEEVPILSISKSGPAQAQAGSPASYSIALSNEGGATAASLTVSDSLPDGTQEPVTGVPSSLATGRSGTASSSYTIPASQPAGPLTDTAAVVWTDSNGDSYGPVSSSFTTQVTSSYQGAGLTLSPASAGPDVVGTSQTLTATFLDESGNPVVDQTIDFTVAGANPTTGTGVTNSAGVASFSYTGTVDGIDTVQASFGSGAGSIQSNTATVGWVTPAESISTSSVTGRFYYNNCDTFCADVSQPPLWTQSFPTINFDPPDGTIPGNQSVDQNTRPFADVTTNDAGAFTGTELVQGKGYQAGVGSLFQFGAVFTGEYVVAAPGDVTFSSWVDDGFYFGIGGGATPVSGSSNNVPSETALDSYPTMGGYNNQGAHWVSDTVDFPSAGSYPYEVDYYECCAGTLGFTMTSNQGHFGLPPAGNLSLTPLTLPTQPVGGRANLTVTAMDASGKPIADLPVILTMSGANVGDVTGTTGPDGTVELSYTGTNPGIDSDQVGAAITGMPAVSNVVNVPWAYSASTGTGSSSGSSSAPPPAISSASPADGAIVTAPTPITATITPPSGEAITQWSVTATAASTGVVTDIASRTGSPPTPLATLDPTLLPDDSYTITISATASGGGVQTVTSTVDVSGNLKPGRYVSTYQDLSIPIGDLTVAVDRTYDSYDTTAGDFGVGWKLQLSDISVTANRELGAGGWTEYATSCFIICSYGYKTSVAHYVTVTFADGHQDTFEFTPDGPQMTLLNFQTGTAAFSEVSGRDAGATLQVTSPSQQTFYPGWDGNLYTDSSESSLYNPTELTLTLADGTSYVLSEQSGLVLERDASGNTITVSPTGVQMTLGPASNPTPGPSIAITRNASGDITEVAGPDDGVKGEDQHVLYSYNGAGQLATVTDPEGNVTSYQYSATGLLTGISGPNGPIQTVTYGSDGRITSIANGSEPPTTITTEPGAEQQVVEDPNGKLSTVYTYDALGDVIQKAQTFGGQTLTTTMTYDASGRMTSLTDPAGDTQTWTYDESTGDLLAYTDASGRTWTFENYTTTGHPGTVIGPNGSVYATSTYSSEGLLLSSDVTGEPATSYTYTPEGQAASVTDPAGRTTTYAYNADGFLASESDGAGDTTSFTTDASGDVLSVTDPSGDVTRYAYDGSGKMISETDGAGVVYTYTYDNQGHVTSSGDASGTTTYAYNGAGQVTQRKDADGGVTTYAYDADGNLTEEVLPGGATTTYQYNPLEELVEAENGSSELNFSYDGAGNLLTQTSCAPQASGGACPANSPTAAEPTATLTYTWDPNGLEASVTGPGGTTNYQYSSDDQLSSVTDAAGHAFSYTDTAQSQVASLSLPNGVSQALSYDPSGLLVSDQASAGGSAIAGDSYTLSSVTGQRTSVTTPQGTSGYTYQPNGWLASETQPSTTGLPSQGFTYDGAGDLTSWGGAPAGTVSYNSAGELTQAGAYTYTYNAAGDRTSETDTSTGATTTYTWNADDQLLSITYPNGTTSSYEYDPLGRRISVDNDGQVTRYVYDGYNVAAEYDGQNALTTAYTLTPTQASQAIPQDPASVLESVGSGVTSYYVEDANGSTVATTGSSGTVTARYAYSAYGVPSPTNGPGTTYSFDGAQYDPSSGLYHMGSRYYDPVTASFLSQDPVAAESAVAPLGNWTLPRPSSDPSIPTSGQRYSFASNDPVDLIDPSGEGARSTALAFACVVNLLLGGAAAGVPSVSSFTDQVTQCITEVVKDLGQRQAARQLSLALESGDNGDLLPVLDEAVQQGIPVFLEEEAEGAFSIETPELTAQLVLF